MNLFFQPNCDYNPVNQNFKDQNFGNPYDCPEGMYGGSMMSSVGYSQVSILIVNNFFSIFKKLKKVFLIDTKAINVFKLFID